MPKNTVFVGSVLGFETDIIVYSKSNVNVQTTVRLNLLCW